MYICAKNAWNDSLNWPYKVRNCLDSKSMENKSIWQSFVQTGFLEWFDAILLNFKFEIWKKFIFGYTFMLICAKNAWNKSFNGLKISETVLAGNSNFKNFSKIQIRFRDSRSFFVKQVWKKKFFQAWQ